MQIKNYRWLVVAMLFFATTINYLDRQIIGLLKPTLEKEFTWTETDFAHIIMAFTAAYALGLSLLDGSLIRSAPGLVIRGQSFSGAFLECFMRWPEAFLASASR